MTAAPFVGWQRQDNGPSIQGALEQAVLAFSGERVRVQGAGRTDSGVHALGQVAHFDLAGEKPAEDVRAPSTSTSSPIRSSVTEAEIVPADFHARFSATGAALSLPDPEPSRAAGDRPRPCLARAGAARRPTPWPTPPRC